MKLLSKYLILLFAGLSCFISACDNQNSTIYVDPEKKTQNGESLKPASPDAGLRLGIGSIITPKEGFIYYRRLVEYMEKKLNMPVTVTDRGSYQEFNDLLAKGGLDVAFVCGGPYVEGKDAFALELLVVPETPKGETVYYANLIVPHDSSAQGLEDLRGGRFAFTDPQSNSGKLVPTYLLAKLGETPENFFSELIYTYAHDKSIHAVAEGEVDGASVDSLIYEYMVAQNPDLTAKVRVLSQSDPYGIPPVVVRPDISTEMRGKLRTVLLEMARDPEGQEILHGMQIKRFVESDDAAYDTIRQIREFTRKQSKD